MANKTAKPRASVVTCPLCGAAMVERDGAHGRFWGCTKYPACFGNRPLAAGKVLRNVPPMSKSLGEQNEAWHNDPKNELQL